LVISEFCCYRFSHSIDIYIDSSNNCSDTSDTHSALGILKFPEEDYHSDIDFTGDSDDDGVANMDTMETHFNLPASLTELQKKLLQGYTTPEECSDSVFAPRDLSPSEMLSLWHYIA
jgi:hypothetical protein